MKPKKTPEEERLILGFMLPDLLGQPIGFSDEKGDLIFMEGNEIPPNHFIFSISIEEWKEITK